MERTERIEEEIKKVASKVIGQELKDPRLTGLISVTKVSITRDLKYCKIYVSMLGTKDIQEAMLALKSGSGLVRKAIGDNIRMHSTPEVIFEFDNSLEYGAHIQNVINELNIQHDEENEDE
ncbi:MAG: 30S ribosome-binding factor RbfA [Clostridia bacterium]|nr:30S ribosome-binding factor RbfA [Clostridia bacterium]